jgi:hypothetical protein
MFHKGHTGGRNMKYEVEFIAHLELEVDAENEIEAEEKAHELINMRDFVIIDTTVGELTE